MKVLHTADWYLGRKILGREVSAFQSAVIDEIATVAEMKNVDVVIVAGNVFDINAGASAVNTFLQAVDRITDGGKRALVLTAGEHDNVAMLESFSHLTKNFNLAILTKSGTIVDYGELPAYAVNPVESGRGYIVYENAEGERITIGALVTSGMEVKSSETYLNALQKNIDAITKKFESGAINVIAGNLRIATENDLMTDDDMPTAEMFPFDTSYVALGGLMRSEIADSARNAYYSGSILPYDCEENRTDKCVLIASFLEGGELKKDTVRLKNSKKIKKIKCTSLQDATDQLLKYDDCFVDMSLTSTAPIKEAEKEKLFKENGNLLKLSVTVTAYHEEKKKITLKTSMTDEEVFKSFLTNKTSESQDPELIQLFTSIMEETR